VLAQDHYLVASAGCVRVLGIGSFRSAPTVGRFLCFRLLVHFRCDYIAVNSSNIKLVIKHGLLAKVSAAGGCVGRATPVGCRSARSRRLGHN
jgi:hypothetical protein